MAAVKKSGVCLTLPRLPLLLALLLAGLAILPRPGFARAESADDVFPEVLGVKLGGDIRDYPGMEPTGPFFDGSNVYERKSDKDMTFAGIPLIYSGYTVYENRISRIYFSFAPDNLEKMATYLKTTYDRHLEYDEENYRCYESDFSVVLESRKFENRYVVTFCHMPLLQKRKSERLGVEGLEYNNVYLNEPIAKYMGQGMLPYSFLKPEMDFAPGRMDYRRFVEDTRLGGPGSMVIYQTWRGRIYQILVFFDLERSDEVLAALREKYKQWDSELWLDEDLIYCWNLGEYTIALSELERDPENGLLMFTYDPLWLQAHDVDAEYRYPNYRVRY